MSSDIKTFVSPLQIDVKKLAMEVEGSAFGAVVTFSGNVRSSDNGKEVLALTYEIHPTSAEILDHVVRSVCAKYEILSARVAHRYGTIQIGESALFVAVAAPHRQPAFLACTELVDQIKLNLPIWKHQTFADGTDEWVNSA